MSDTVVAKDETGRVLGTYLGGANARDLAQWTVALARQFRLSLTAIRLYVNGIRTL